MLKSWIARTCVASVVCAAVPAAAVAAGDPQAGYYKAQTCMGCHGTPGYDNVYPTYKVPKLGGQHATYIEAALRAYAGSQRSHETMHANAVSLSDQDIADIAAYFSQPAKR
jgi:cytochrome c553